MAKNTRRKKATTISEIKRIQAVALFFVIAIMGYLGRQWYLQVYAYDEMTEKAQGQRLVEKVIPATRGSILSRDGYTFAHSVSLNMIYADAISMNPDEKEAASKALGSVLRMDPNDIYELLQRESRYVPIAHYVDEESANTIREFDIFGIVITSEEKRSYPEGTLASHVIGFVNSEWEGNYGIEQYYNAELAGVDGYIKREVDISQRPIPVGINEEVDVVDGYDLILTIDRSVQKIVEEKLAWGVGKSLAENGSVIVLDPSTGEILAMAGYPNYDPNEYTDALYDENGEYVFENFSTYTNKIVSYPFEPGSVFKVVTMASGIDSGIFHVGDTIYDDGVLEIDNWSIYNWDGKGHGYLTLSQCLEISNNICLAKISSGLGAENFTAYLDSFGFGDRLGVDLMWENTGYIGGIETWDPVKEATAGFGQGVAATPLQLASAVGAIANRGRLMRPYVIKQEVRGSESLTIEPQFLRQVISVESAESVTDMMVNVVEYSEGQEAKIEGYTIAGKTGTAQVVLPGHSSYSDSIFNVSFVGFAPAEAPKFLIFVTLHTSSDTPPGMRWGSISAAPIFREIAKELLQYYEIPPIGY